MKPLSETNPPVYLAASGEQMCQACAEAEYQTWLGQLSQPERPRTGPISELTTLDEVQDMDVLTCDYCGELFYDPQNPKGP